MQIMNSSDDFDNQSAANLGTAEGDSPSSPGAVLPHIDTIIVLMLENRSLDTMLGWLHSDGLSRINLIPKTSQPPHFDGIAPANNVNWSNGVPYTPWQGFAGLGEQRWRVPRQDPAESMHSVHRQMYGYGSPPHLWGDNAPMSGFASDYTVMLPPALGEVMGAYTKAELPILYELAENFAVSDRWFCSVPTETDPNRTFVYCGTSLGKENDLDHPFSCPAPTIFNVLNTTKKTWGIAVQTDFAGFPYTRGKDTYSEKHFDGVRSALHEQGSKGRMLLYSDLLEGLRMGEGVPNFCFVEPAWGAGMGDADNFIGVQGNDYHAPTWVGPAEAHLGELFNALVSSPLWHRSLLLVTFDEHGGTWDHVSPPGAIRPDDSIGKSGFLFDRLGPRVPTLLISPFIRPRTVFRPQADSDSDANSGTAFDHTSIIATVLAWAGAKPNEIGKLGKRVIAAPKFDHVFTGSSVQPHPTEVTIPVGFAEQCPIGFHGMPEGTEHLTLQDIKAAAAVASNMAEYIAELLRLAALRR